MNNIIEVIARGLFIQEGNLLVCHNTENLYAYLPGGHVEFGESCEQALLREWQEELACACQIEKYLQHFEDFFTDTTGKKHHEYTFLYQVNCATLKLHYPIPHPEPDLFFDWIPMNEIRKHNILPTAIRDYIAELYGQKA